MPQTYMFHFWNDNKCLQPKGGKLDYTAKKGWWSQESKPLKESMEQNWNFKNRKEWEQEGYTYFSKRTQKTCQDKLRR